MAGEMILHSDLNCFYASVEMNENPYLRGKAIAVCGSTEDRHGIVLTANAIAKGFGIQTGMANWQAKQVCPNLIILHPRYERYLHFSRLMRKIYLEYSDRVEAFGLDENWVDLSNPGVMIEDGDTYGTLRGVSIDGTAEIVDDPDTCLRVGISVWERYTGPYTDEMRPFVDQMMNNRVAVRVVPSRMRSWDHRKLGMPDMPISGSTAQYLGRQ